jgi:signal transduction histidine kinase
MLGNLLDNACKAANSRVQVRATQSGKRLRVSIADDGAGIAAEQVPHALQRGQRLDETTPGSGLGLAIVQELVTLYGGSLALEASELGGLQAVVELPAA